ncbi:MAG: ribosomal protein S18-alanine N-acetyltransferase [Gammaproteobacteria bacterium]|nr:ribosomal protein S18-alanine N-acetyltransferase [Gammaproteobacteria bacterium]
MSVAVESLRVNVRPMRPADVVRVEEIEKATYPFPWSLGIFRDCLQTGYICRVLDTSGGLAGYAVVSVAESEAHILNLCIVPERRQQQLGAAFLQHLLEELAELRVERVILEVRPSNTAAQRLYGRAGFTQLGVRRGYYPAEIGREDALVLARSLPVDLA